MDLAMATVQNSPPEVQQVARYLGMLVLGCIQGVSKEALMRPSFIARGFPSDYWTTHVACGPVQRVLSMLPDIPVPTDYSPSGGQEAPPIKRSSSSHRSNG
ncbi:hypothetical protein H310_13276 [Aphanomyces invadans]|uniref:Uncharacterized protein n=1 Tax=Aphanomyces invadans TaxID=157072 RepID=A0A024TFM4_9STRA|nr:hypothetical protein H310_13276 [Aphanomyces invadans]ETV92381.1 hypothetical protein H310_13276 [Aphanomyces invadans]|eukprot:XP_008878932.1 hypothetical protein H310_13276 [Aphanomyces invadans]